MRKIVLAISLATLGLMATTDFSQLSTEELINLRGTVAVEDRDAFISEMQSRMATMTPEERATLQASRQISGSATGGQGANRATLPTFSSIDTDGDGKITQAELDAVRASRLQSNSDAGRLSLNVGTAPSLSTIDTNGDGVIDATEFQTHQTSQMASQTSLSQTGQSQAIRQGGGQGQRMGGGGHR